MDSTFMQKETVRGMGGMMPSGSPRPLEAPAKQSLESMGYGDSAQKCEGCEHFDGAQSMCSKAGEQVDPGGHCSEWEGGDGEGMQDAEESEAE